MSQTKVKIDPTSNVLVSTKPAKQPDLPTNQVYVDNDGVKYPVYKNSKGRLYVVRKSKKTGKEYKQYLELTTNNSWQLKFEL